MISRCFSACPAGVDAVPIIVEVDVRQGKLRISIVGLPDAATRESRERLIPAISNSGYALQCEEVVINLSPADLRKEGTAYDLPMAVGILSAKGIIPPSSIKPYMFFGELALDGTLRPVRGVLAFAECARRQGFDGMIVPKGNGAEAGLVPNLEVYEVESLSQLMGFLRDRIHLTPQEPWQPSLKQENDPLDLQDVKGHASAKRALEIAAAGQHNLLMFGPPGSGKSMLSKRLPSILPPLAREEMLEVTRIYSCAGLLPGEGGPMHHRPFRHPHHTASPVALTGGGSIPKPGEVTLAHRGVLFLDELPEFPRRVLEVLRQPLEDRQVTVCRAQQRLTFPSDFLMVAAMNPCPCGWRGDSRRTCSCSAHQVAQYRHRLSGPLLDRIDLHVEVPVMPLALLRKLAPAESSRTVARRVGQARAIQQERFQSSLITNATMSGKQLSRFCPLDKKLAQLFETYVEALGMSSRVLTKVLAVARTIADLDGGRSLRENDILEALSYRQLDKKPKLQPRGKEVTV